MQLFLREKTNGFFRESTRLKVLSSDVRYIDFISISRYFFSNCTISKSILHLLMLDNYRTAEFSINILTVRLDINLSKGIATE